MAAAEGERERRRLPARLLDEATEPLLALDEQGITVVANAAAARYFGRERRYLLGKPFASLVALDDRRELRRAVAHAEAVPCRLSLRLLRHGEPAPPAAVDLRIVARAPRTLSVRVIEHTPPPPPATADDVLALEVERLLLRLPQAVIGIDDDGGVRFANARARGLFRDPGLRRGRPLPSQLGDVSLERLRARLAHEPGTIPPQLVELADGRRLRITGSAAKHDQVSALLVIDDISVHTKRYASEELFVRNAAHQLRTPLSGIANAMEVLQSGAKDDPDLRDRFLAHIDEQTQRLTRLTRALLVLARAHAQVQAPRLELVPLEPVLARAAASVEPEPGVDVAVSCPPRLAVLAEPDLLEEALAAMAENAVRHTHAGAVSLRAWAVDGRELEIEIADSGDGILPEHRERIFDPFYRAAADGTGFGIGLAIAEQAVSAMGGRIEVHSQPRRGTRFTLRLPSAEVVSA